MRLFARFLASLLLLTGLSASFRPALAEADLSLFDLSAEIAVFGVDSESYYRSCGETAALSGLAADEFYTYALTLRYTGSQPIEMKNLTVSVDGGEKWGWADHTLQPDAVCLYHVYYSNMKSRMTEGAHTVTWYLDNRPIFTKTFTFVSVMDWSSAFPIPSAEEIARCNANASVRSPYLYGWLDVSESQRFTEYSVDFKADTLPEATYVCLANMKMDLSSLKKRYSNVHTEYDSVNMYAGFQRRWNDETNSIMSFWDIYYTDENGNEQTLRGRRVYPPEPAIGDGSFTGEGSGAQNLIPFRWEAGRWYRMLLQCSTRAETGTTQVDQWVLDLETGVWTLLAQFDTGVPDSCFTGPVAFFLENFDPASAGEVRTMEVANIRLRDAASGQWKGVSSATLGSNGGLPAYEGSYAYGADGSRFWMITSGVGGDWYAQGRVPQNQRFSVSSVSSDSPY